MAAGECCFSFSLAARAAAASREASSAGFSEARARGTDGITTRHGLQLCEKTALLRWFASQVRALVPMAMYCRLRCEAAPRRSDPQARQPPGHHARRHTQSSSGYHHGHAKKSAGSHPWDFGRHTGPFKSTVALQGEACSCCILSTCRAMHHGQRAQPWLAGERSSPAACCAHVWSPGARGRRGKSLSSVYLWKRRHDEHCPRHGATARPAWRRSRWWRHRRCPKSSPALTAGAALPRLPAACK